MEDMKKILHDNFGNTATIEEVFIFAYNGAKEKEKAYRLLLTSDYDNDFLYHVSVHESMQDVKNKLKKLSCNNWN